METKKCTKCGIEKELSSENFCFKKHKKSGFNSTCKECDRIYREKSKGQRQEWLNNNPDWMKKWKQNNSEHIKQYQLKYRAENFDKISLQEKEYKEKNKESIRVKAAIYKIVNKDKAKKQFSEWRALNRDKLTVIKHRRVSRERSIENNFSKEQWVLTKNKFDNKCAYCGDETKLTLDHFVPLSKGGELTINNVIPCCLSCNSSKKAQDYFIWYEKQDFYSPDRNKKILDFLNYKVIKGVPTQQLRLLL